MANPPDTGTLGRIADGLIRWKGTLLLIALLATLASIPLASRLQLDQRIEAFFAEDDPRLLSFQDSREWFGGDEFVMVAYEDDNLMDGSNLVRLRRFADELSEVPGIVSDSTQTLETLLHPRFGTAPVQRIFARAYARMNQEDILEFGENLVISGDRKTTGIILRLAPQSESGGDRRETFEKLRELAAAHDPPAVVAGEPLQVHDMFRYVQQDSALLGWASTGLLTALILLLFRSVRWVVLPLLIVHCTLIWTKAVLAVSGLRLSMVSSMLTSLVTIIGVATVMHVTLVFRAWRNEVDRPEAFRRTFLELAKPIAWTCLTTAIGFLALLSSSIVPIRSFGLMLGLASLLIVPCAVLLLPGGILIGGLDCDPKPVPAEGRLLSGLTRLCGSLERYPRTLLGVMIALMVIGGTGTLFLTVETDFSRNFRDSSPIVKALEFFESRLGGAGTWEIHFPAPDELTEETLVPVRELASELRGLKTSDGATLTKVVAVSDGVDFAPGSGLRQKLSRLTTIQPDFIKSLYNPEAGHMRIMLRSPERQPAEVKLRLIDDVTRIAQKHFPEARTTGLYVLLANLISSIQRDQYVSSILSAMGVFSCIALMHRSVWLGFVSLFPNMFPLMIVIGGMGWLGIPINIGTAMIACVSMGMTDDSSIHYLREYVDDRKSGINHLQAMHSAHNTVGPALVFATLVLTAGFLVLTLSNFIPLVYFGGLVALSMLGGLFGGLILLPLLLQWVPFRVTLPEELGGGPPPEPGESPPEGDRG